MSIAAGAVAGSVSLIGFGLDSLIEVTSGAALLWRLHADLQVSRREEIERKTLQIVGLCFLALAAYIAFDSLVSLIRHEAPKRSLAGIVIAALSLCVMPLLAKAKRRVAVGIGSAAMHADSRQTDFCTYLSAILLGGLVLNAAFGLWWADPVAGLVMVPIIGKEGMNGSHGQILLRGWSMLLRLALALAIGSATILPAGQLFETAAELTLTDLNGHKRSLTDYRGKIVVLNFWATWCIPCRAEMPLLVSVYNRYADLDVIVIGASADEESTQGKIEPFVRKLKISFPIWTGASTNEMEKLGLGTGLPATAIIDRDGKIVGRILGILEKNDLRNRIEYLLGNRQGPAPVPLIDQISEAQKEGKGHKEEEDHHHGGVSMEGASTVPS